METKPDKRITFASFARSPSITDKQLSHLSFSIRASPFLFPLPFLLLHLSTPLPFSSFNLNNSLQIITYFITTFLFFFVIICSVFIILHISILNRQFLFPWPTFSHLKTLFISYHFSTEIFFYGD